VGGNVGSSIGPLLAAFIVLPLGQQSVAWFGLFALLGIFVLTRVGHWARVHGLARLAPRARKAGAAPPLSAPRVRSAIAVLLALIFSKYFYLASLTSYYTFYLIEHFRVDVRGAQIMLFAFLGAVALGTIFGGPLGDRFGRKIVIWVSILGVLPFTLALPHANLPWTVVLTLPIGFILASAFPAIVVYAQELMPGKTGTVAGLFFGFAFGMGSIGAAVLGALADATSIEFVYRVCAWLPVLGILAALLPNIEQDHRPRA
jgi:FSR family fosmidomycin resistance protein-like MFS transporter